MGSMGRHSSSSGMGSNGYSQSGSDSSGFSQYSSGSDHISPVSPAPAESSGFSDMNGGSGSNSGSGSFHTGEASIPNQFRARAAAVTSTNGSEQTSELKPVSNNAPEVK